MILAGIDIGTNTLRLLVADTRPDSFREIHSDRRITRLGESLDRTGILSSAAIARSLEVLAHFGHSIRKYGAVDVSVVGTSALRMAENGAEFVSAVQARTGLAVEVIDGQKEARLTLLGVSRALGDIVVSPRTMVIDIGGGSTEILSNEPSFEASLPLGAVYLTERFLAHDPPLAAELGRLRERIGEALRSSVLRLLQPDKLIGTAGTITTLASVDQRLSVYDPDRINGATLSRDSVNAMVDILSRCTVSDRRSIPGLEPGREDIILAGAVIVQEIMERWKFPDLLVSEGGLREGIVIDLYAKMITREK